MWREWCQRVGLWLAQRGGWTEAQVIAPYTERILAERNQLAQQIEGLRAKLATSAVVPPEIFARARALTNDAETTLTGGEAKRHAVYARIIKEFPATSKRELALAIELALFHSQKEG